MVKYAYVKIWGELVGVVIWDENRQLANFQYDEDFLKKNWDLAPVKMPISDGNRIYNFPENIPPKDSSENTFKGLPGLLADSLPDKYGNQLIEKWLAQNGRSPNSMNPVEMLCFIGSRGMGALEYEPAQLISSRKTYALEVESLIEIAKKVLSKRNDFKTTLNEEELLAMKEILKIGTSAGGARPKAVITYNKKTKEIRSGQANAPKGFEHWIIKLDGVSGVQFGESLGWGRVEYAYYLMACECGIDMTECGLLEENNRAHFITKRFDREGTQTKHHVQTLCGLRHFDYNDMYSYSYEQVFQTMRMLRLTYPEAEQMFRRMVFNVLATNCDDHTKNFSFRLKKDSKWELAPAYDMCYAYDPTNVWVSQQTLSVNGKQNNITKEDLLTISKANNIKKGEKIIDHINTVVKGWNDFALTVKVKDNLRKVITANLHTF